MEEETNLKEGKNLLSIFIFVLVLSLITVLGTYFLTNFEISVLVGICLTISTITVLSVGIENILINEIRNQIVRLRSQVKGYLTDMYSEMIQEDK